MKKRKSRKSRKKARRPPRTRLEAAVPSQPASVAE
jgi:hypothetical protein